MSYSSVRLITAPTIEPVTTTECKLDARVDSSTEDTLFTSWIAAARQLVEQVSRRALITRTLELSLDAWPTTLLRLPFPPLIAVSQITYYDAADTLTTLAASCYTVVADEEPGWVGLGQDQAWPADLHLYPRIRIRYTAGYGAAAAAVPETYKLAIRGLVKLQYDYRSGWTPDAERAQAIVLANVTADWGW